MWSVLNPCLLVGPRLWKCKEEKSVFSIMELAGQYEGEILKVTNNHEIWEVFWSNSEKPYFSSGLRNIAPCFPFWIHGVLQLDHESSSWDSRRLLSAHLPTSPLVRTHGPPGHALASRDSWPPCLPSHTACSGYFWQLYSLNISNLNFSLNTLSPLLLLALPIADFFPGSFSNFYLHMSK